MLQLKLQAKTQQ